MHGAKCRVHTILGLSKSYAQWKHYILKIYRDSESAKENHTLDLNVHKLNPSGANEEQNQGSLINPKSSARCLEL